MKATKIKSGVKLTIAGDYEADIKKTDSVTLANKVQLPADSITFTLAYVERVTGSKFDDSVSLLTAPLKTGNIDLGRGNDTLKINGGEYKLTLKNTETVVGDTETTESLQLSGVAAFSTDGSIDTLLGDKSGQTITFTSINADSTIDLGKGKDTIILADSIGEYELAFEEDDDAITVIVDGKTLTIKNEAAGVNKSLKLVIDGITYTWDQAIAYAVDNSADADANPVAVAVAEGDLVTNNAEKGHVQLTITGVDSDAASVVVYLAAAPDNFVEAVATKQKNGTWAVAPQDLSDLPDGQIGVFARVTDHKGNEAWAGNPLDFVPYATLILDTTADEDAELAVALAGGDTLSQTAKDNSDETPVAFEVTGRDEDVQPEDVVVRISDGSSQVLAILNEDTGFWEADLSALGEGPLTASVTVTDAAGNTASVTSEEINVVTDSFEGSVTEFQAQADGYFDDFVSVIVADTANAFNGSDLTGGNWASVNLINVTDGQPVTFSAAELSGLTLTLGTGNFVISGTGTEIAQLPASILSSLDNGDIVEVTDALSVAELETLAPIFETDAQFTYALSDSAEALLGLAAEEGGHAALAGATAVTVEGSATVAQIGILLSDVDESALTYSALRDTAEALLPEGIAAGVIHGDIDIVVVDDQDEIAALTLAQFNVVDAANGAGTISFKLNDTQAALFGDDSILEPGAANAIAAAEDITVVGALDLAQANALKAANSASYAGVTFDLQDDASTLFNGPISFAAGASEAIAAAGQVIIDGGLSFNRALMVNGANGNSYDSLTFTLADTELQLFNGNGVAELRTDVLEMLQAANAISISGDGLTIAQAQLIYVANGNSFAGVTLIIKDTADNIVDSLESELFADHDDGVTVNVSPTAVDGLSVAELVTLMDRIDNAQDVTYSLTLGELDIFSGDNPTILNPGYEEAIQNATAVTVTDDLTPAQAAIINTINADAVYDVASGAADAVNPGNEGGMNGARDITITGTVSAAAATIIAGFGNDGTTTYDVEDNAAAAIDVANAAGMNDARDITITDTVSAAAATIIAGFGNDGMTTYDVEDNAAAAIEVANAAGMNGARNITITAPANVLQATAIAGFNNSGDTIYHIEDDKAGVFVGETAAYDSSAAITGATSVTLTTAITVAQAAALKASLQSSDVLTAITYSIVDTKEAIIGATDAGLFVSGDGITVLDVDVVDTNLGTISTADYATLTTRIGNDQDPLTFTYSFVKSDLFDPADSTDWKTGAAAAIQSATTVGISEALTAAQAQAVYTANNDGSPATLTMDIADTAANITNVANGDGVNASRHVSVNGTGINATAATVVGTIEAFTNTGNTTYAEVTGSVTDVTTALGGGNAGRQGSVANITVTGNATASDITTVEGYSNTGTQTYAGLADTAAAVKSLLNGAAALQARIGDLTVNGTGVNATVAADLVVIEGYGNTGNQTYSEVTDTVEALTAVLEGNAELQGKVSDLTVTGSATTTEVSTIEGYANTGDQTYAEVTGTAAAVMGLLGGNADLQGDIAILTVNGTGDDATSAVDVTTIEAYFNTGTTTYAEVIGEAAAIKAALDANTDAVQGRVGNITVTGATATADVTTIEGYSNTGDQAYDEVTGVADDVISVVGTGGQYLQEDITTLTVTGTTSFANASTINNYDQYVGTVNFDRVDATYAQLADSNNAAIFANADEVRLTDYNIGEVTVADVAALLANANLKDIYGNAIAVGDLTFTLRDTATNLTAGGNTADIMAAASSVTVDNDGDGNADTTVLQAKTIYDRNGNSTFDIVDTASWLATTAGVGSGADYDTVIKAGRDLTATTVASAVQADVIYDRDGADGDLFYDVSDSYSNLTNGGYADGVAYAKNITVSGGYSNYWGGGANDATALYALASTGDANGTANLFMGERYYDTVAEWKAFIVTGSHPVDPGVLEYTYKVYDNASNVAAAADNEDVSVLTGSTEVRVSDNMLVAQAETLWTALVGPFGGTLATAAKTYYQISDSVANLSNAKVSVNAAGDIGDDAAVANADVIYVYDTAAAIHAAQNSNASVDLGDAQVFQRMDELGSGGMIATASAGNQIIAGSKHGDNLNGGADQDILYGNAGNDTLYGGAGNDTLYGGDGRDTIYAGTAAGEGTGLYYRAVNDRIYGGNGGDNMFGSGSGGDYDRDQFIFAGNTRSALIAESGTFTTNRDYISNFGLGDSIDFSSVNDGNVQFFGSGSANAIAVTPGTLALSIRYEKNQQVMNWEDTALVTATKVMVDIANEQGVFDDVADMHIIIVGSNIDLNWNGSALAFGG